MTQKIVVGPMSRGLRNDRLPFYVDNESFPVLTNAYQWRGRVKRKRGTSTLGRLNKYFDSTINPFNPTGTSTQTLDGSGNGNLLTGFTNLTTLSPNASLVPTTISILDTILVRTYTDPNGDGILTDGSGHTGTVNYITGAITILPSAGNAVSAHFSYYPDLPVMGLEDLLLDPTAFPGNLAFDTKYSYNITPTFPYRIYNVSFYKNPSNDGTLMPGYNKKTNPTPLVWNGQSYQQFWTTNYQNALWETNGIQVPFNPSNIGMQYKAIVTTTVVAGGPPAIVTLQITGHGLVTGDFVFVNEVVTTTGINLQTGYVVSVGDVDHVNVEFPLATIAGNGTGGIAQYLTNSADATKDCIRWYDGNPTSSNGTVVDQPFGWVNFAPPLSNALYSIDTAPPAIYYLVGARIVFPFKDRILFFGPVIQASGGTPIYLQDTIVYSQNGTAFYTGSFTGDPTLGTTVVRPLLVPVNQTATPTSFFEDVSGFGGFISSGLQQPIISIANNEDVLIAGFSSKQARIVYTGSDIVPFNIFIVNSELGSESTFSVITLDRGVLTIGEHGIIMAQQVGAERIDLEIPDQVFQINLDNNGPSRITAQRDFISEWIYFSYPSNQISYVYPNQTLLYNYRDNSWGLFNESYTTYGQFRRESGQLWSDLTDFTWSSWNDPWNSGSQTLFQPEVIAGNQQGFVMVRQTELTDEGNSLYIQNIVANVVTSPDHCLNNGDYIYITGALGTPNVNNTIYIVSSATTNTFHISNEAGLVPTGSYTGGGLIKRLYIYNVQTKQFPISWEMSRKTRIGSQMYLLSKTNNGQCTLYIFLSQNSGNPYNAGPYFPNVNSPNNSLIYTSVLYTCPEGTNLGLTPANINLNMVTGADQQQIWHRINTSLLGDTIQLGFTLSNSQMFDPTFSNQITEFELHGFVLDVSPSQLLA